MDIASACSIGTPFVTSVMVDPADHHTIWVGVEIDGVFRSRDGGESWRKIEREFGEIRAIAWLPN